MENEKQVVANSDEQKEVGQPTEETLTMEELDEVSGGLIRTLPFQKAQPSTGIETDLLVVIDH
jgi:hypothetical protein